MLLSTNVKILWMKILLKNSIMATYSFNTYWIVGWNIKQKLVFLC